MERDEANQAIGDVTLKCHAALAPLWGDQYHVTSVRNGTPVAFEFWWPEYGAEGARRIKVVVSDATSVGVENMVYPPK